MSLIFLSPIEIKSKQSNCFSIHLLVIQNFFSILFREISKINAKKMTTTQRQATSFLTTSISLVCQARCERNLGQKKQPSDILACCHFFLAGFFCISLNGLSERKTTRGLAHQYMYLQLCTEEIARRTANKIMAFMIHCWQIYINTDISCNAYTVQRLLLSDNWDVQAIYMVCRCCDDNKIQCL